jgi:hypothetical protein
MRGAAIFWILLMTQALAAQKLVSYLTAARAPEAFPSEVDPVFPEIPFDLVNGMIMVKASIDGKDAGFILDTGAPMLVLNEDHSKKEKSFTDGQDNLASSCSGTMAVGMATIRHFTWGTLEKENIEALTVDLSHLEKAVGRPVRGLIGFQIFKDREIFIDYTRQRILLLDPQNNLLHRAATPLETSSFSMYDHLPILQLDIGGHFFRFGIDTGSEANLIDDCATANIDASLFDTLKMEEIQGLDQKVSIVPVIQLSETRLGHISLKALPYLVIELCHLEKIHGARIDGLLGYDFFNNLKVSINYPKKEIYFWSLRESM